MRWASLILVAGCGRVAFDTRAQLGDSGAPGGDDDGAVMADAPVPGAVVHYAFEDPYDAAGVAFSDSISGQPAYCLDFGCPMPIAGVHGQAYHFDGTLSCIHGMDNAVFHQPLFTIAVWFSLDTTTTNPSLIAKPFGQPSIFDSWQIETYSDLSVALTTYHGAATQMTSPMNAFAANTWTHAAVSWDGVVEKVYINGTLTATTPRSGTIGYDSEPPLIGCDNNSGDSQYLLGSLDDIWIFDHALDPAEIQLLATP